MKICAIIMASGLSNRMGENKLTLDVKGKRMFEYTVDLVSELNFADKILVTNTDEIAEYAKDKVRVFKNEKAQIGKSESIKIGVENSADVDGYIFFVSDQPFVSKETVEELIEKFEETNKITFPMYLKKRGAPMIFPKEYKEALLNLKDDQGGVVLITAENSQSVLIEREMEHFDIDTKEEYEKIK